MGKSAGGGGVTPIEADLIQQQIESGRASSAREQEIFNAVRGAADDVGANVLGLQQGLSSADQALTGVAGRFGQEAASRRAAETGALQQLNNTQGALLGVSQQFGQTGDTARAALRGLDPQFTDQAGLTAQAGLANAATAGFDPTRQRFAGIQAGTSQADLTGNIAGAEGLARQAGQLGSGDFTPSQGIVGEGRDISRLGLGVGQQRGDLAIGAVGQLGEALQGRISPEVQQLFTDAGGTREREVLEAQFQRAENAIREGASSAGGGLERNLAALQAERAFGIAGQEERRTDQQRALARDLFGTALQTGLDAPAQEAGLRAQGAGIQATGGQLGLGAEASRQGAVGLGGQLFGQAGQQRLGSESARQSALGLGAGIFGDIEQQRLQGLGLSGDIRSGIEQQRQQGLTGALASLDTAFGRDFQGLQGQQAALAQRQQLQQALASQLGQGADQLLLAQPNIFGQQASLRQAIAQAPGLEAAVLQGITNTPASSFLGPATQAATQAAATREAAAQQAAAANNQAVAGLGGTLATAGILALAFT